MYSMTCGFLRLADVPNMAKMPIAISIQPIIVRARGRFLMVP